MTAPQPLVANFTAVPTGAALSVSKTHIGNFVQGQQSAAYTLTVLNATAASATSGTITVTDTIPVGLTLVSMSGTGWSCSSNACARADSLAGGSSYPPITVTVNVGPNAASQVTNQVTVSGGGSSGASANDSTLINPPGVGSIWEYPLTSGSVPEGIVTGPDGALWFTESGGNKIGRITTSGSISEFPVPTASSYLYGIAAGPDGALWFTEYGGNKIGRITTAGSISEYSIPTAGSQPLEITPGSDGALWFTELAGNKIGRITTVGSISEYSIPTPGSQPLGITSGPDGALWFTEFGGNKIGRITTVGSIFEYSIPTAGSQPVGIISGPDSALWFTEDGGDKIGRITTVGSISEYSIPTAGSQPAGIVSGVDSAVWFTEYGSDKIGRITTTESMSEYPIPTANSQPFGITSGPDGGLWFTEFGGNRIGRVFTGITLTPALTITKGHSGNFAQGQQNAAYTITVSNTASAGATIGTVTVTDTTPDGLTLVSMSGTGWACSATTCTRGDALNGGSSYPAITVAVNVAANATSPQVNAANVNGGGSAAASTTDPTVIATAVTFQTDPTDLQFSVDGGAALTAPQTLNLAGGSHVITVAQTQAGGAGTQYVFTSWSDGGAASHNITVGSSSATYTATFQTQYQLTTAASPAAGGTLTPLSGGFFVAGTPVAISAMANSGYQFSSWTGNVAAANSAATTVTMGGAETVTANFVSVTGITIQTNPTGLQFTVDGGALQTAPQTLSLTQGNHSLAVVTPQAGTAGTQYVFSGWNDGGAAAHTIAVGTATAVYTAAFTTQYQLTMAVSPAGWGTATPPTGGYYNAGTVVNLTATANSGYQFSNWTGSVAVANSASTTVTMGAAESVMANFVSVTGITIQTSPAGLEFTVDGGAVQTAPQTLNLAGGSHVIAVATPQAGTAGTQYVFSEWSDGGTATHTITVGTVAAGYTATFTTQYQLTTAVWPAGGGTATPAGGYYNAGTVVNLTATANSGYQFNNWTGNVAAANSAATTVTMGGAETVTANFGSVTGITIQTNPAGLQFTVDGGALQTALQTLSLTQGNHSLAVATPQVGTAGTQYVFTAWSDGGAASHSITVTGSATTYTASFTTQYQLTLVASPAAGGTVTPVTGGFFAAGTPVAIGATAGSGYTFQNWTGSGVSNANSAATTVTMSAAETVTANFLPVTGITIQTNPTGLQFTVDGGAPQNAPQALSVSQGSHDIAVPTTQAGTAGTQYVFISWSDGGAASHNIAVGSSGATYTANFQTQYQLTISASPAADGTVSPATGGFYNAGTPVPVTATANSGFQFTNWTGSAASAASASTSVTMSAPETVTANFVATTTTFGLGFIPVTPCRVMDTRSPAGTFGGPSILGGATRNVPIPLSPCNIPSTAQAYSLNVTVVPPGPLTYLSVWPTGLTQPVVSTLNSFDGRVVANAAIVPAGTNGAISVYVSNTTDVVIDINGYFALASTAGSMSLYSATPCRVVDTRNGTGPLAGPFMSGGSTRSFAIPSSDCGIPATAQAYSLNITVAPHASLGYLTTWPTGQSQPLVSTLNSLDGSVVANAAIVPAGTGGAVSVYVTNDTDVIIDIDGYFIQPNLAPPGTTGALLYTLVPCRVADTRGTIGLFGGPTLASDATRSFPVPSGSCNVPSTAQAYSLNVTVVPPGPLTYLTIWPTGQDQPIVSTLNSFEGRVVANAAIVPAGTSGAVSVFVSNATDVILDINAYSAPPGSEPANMPVNLAGSFNRTGIYADGASFSATGGLDGGGFAYSGSLLGNSQTWNGVTFNLGAAGAVDAISCNGSTVSLPAGDYSSLRMLATGVNGSQTATFTVLYTDGSTTSFNQNLSDWAVPQSYAGESNAVAMSYRNQWNMTREYLPIYLYGYSFALANSKTVSGLILPNNSNVEVLALSLVQ